MTLTRVVVAFLAPLMLNCAAAAEGTVFFDHDMIMNECAKASPLCVGFLMGVADTLSSKEVKDGPTICMPEGGSSRDMITAINREFTGDALFSKADGVNLVADMLRKSWPCPAQSQ